MRSDLMEILCCPTCRGELELKVVAKKGEEVWTGNLRCAKCAVDYPIEDGIPNLLPPDERD